MASLFGFKKNKKRSGSTLVSQGSAFDLKTGKPRSKSLENLMDLEEDGVVTIRDLVGDTSREAWTELDNIKSQAPVIVCILPSMAQDFVASCLLSIGAQPLFPEGIKLCLFAIFTCTKVVALLC